MVIKTLLLFLVVFTVAPIIFLILTFTVGNYFGLQILDNSPISVIFKKISRRR